MEDYRIYFFDAAGHIFARHEFTAPDDETAVNAGSVTGEASSDMHSGYAIWRGSRELFSKDIRTLLRLVKPVSLAALSDATQGSS